MQTESKKTIECESDRLAAAKKDFEKIEKEISPFIRKRKIRRYSTRGEWKNTDR